MNKKVFNDKKMKLIPTNIYNEAHGIAYKLSDKATLAQYVLTGTFNNVFYSSAEDQLNKTLELANKVEPQFLAKLAVYARQNGVMKDSPAVLAAVLATKDTDLLAKVFSKVINDPKMLRNFVQVVRSGAVNGKKSFGSRTKKLIQNYLESLTDEQLFRAKVGSDPSLEDIIKMVHPKPSNKQRSALYGYLLDKEYNKKDLCHLAKHYETFKKEMVGELPDVPFQLLTSLPLTDKHWSQIAENATWTQLRLNINAFARHNVLKDDKMVNTLAKRLSDPEQVKKSKVFPYQLFTTYLNMDSSIPTKITNALQDAVEHSLGNVPEFNGKVFMMIDVSGSMSSPVTGNRGSVTSKTTCTDVAALFAAAVLHKNPDTEIIPFDTQVHVNYKFNPRDSVVTNAKTLAAFGGGGTNCASALEYVNRKVAKGDLVIYVSDNQSWYNSGAGIHGATNTMTEWNKFKARNKSAKLVNIDIQPYSTTQMHDREDVLNLGGFNDNVFAVIKQFVESGSNKDLWIKTIEEVSL